MTLGTLLQGRETGLTARVWAEVDLGAIQHNIQALRRHFGYKTEIMAVIKANAYGLGAVEVARTALKAGAISLAVACCEEGLQLRDAGLNDCKILVLGPIPVGLIPAALSAKLTLAVVDTQTLSLLSREAQQQNIIAKIQLKLETGLHRGGLDSAAALELARLAKNLPNLKLDGLYTHFATGDEPDPDFVLEQQQRYYQTRDLLAANGFNFPEEHLANSASSIRLGKVRGRLVRVGIALLGYHPSETVAEHAEANNLELKPALTLKSTIVRLHWIEAGESVGYGRTFVAQRPTRVALVPIGYADGYRRELSNRAEVLVNGQRAKVIGRVSMDQITLDVTAIPDLTVNDEVVLIGQQGQHEVSLEEIADLCDTIGYEILTGLGNRVKRVYVKG